MFTTETNITFAFKTQVEVCLKIKMHLKCETQGAFCILNAKSQMRSMKINVTGTVLKRDCSVIHKVLQSYPSVTPNALFPIPPQEVNVES